MPECRDSAGCDMLRALLRMFECDSSGTQPAFVTLRVGSVRPRTDLPYPEGDDAMAVTVLGTRDEFDLSLTNIRDARGRPTSFDGIPTWQSSDPNVVDLRVAPNGLSAIAGSLDTFGTATITVTGDGRQGDEVLPVVGLHTVTVQPGDVSVFEFTAGEVRPRAEEPPPAA